MTANDLFDLCRNQLQGGNALPLACTTMTPAMSVEGEKLKSIVLMSIENAVVGFVVTTQNGQSIHLHRFDVEAEQYQAQQELLRAALIPAYPISPVVMDGCYVEVSIRGENAQLEAGWWTESPEGYDSLDNFVLWMEGISGANAN